MSCRCDRIPVVEEKMGPIYDLKNIVLELIALSTRFPMCSSNYVTRVYLIHELRVFEESQMFKQNKNRKNYTI